MGEPAGSHRGECQWAVQGGTQQEVQGVAQVGEGVGTSCSSRLPFEELFEAWRTGMIAAPEVVVVFGSEMVQRLRQRWNG